MLGFSQKPTTYTHLDHLTTPEATSTIHLHRTLNQIKSMGCMAGVVLNPGTPLSQIEYVLTEVPTKIPGGSTFLDGFETRMLVLPTEGGWLRGGIFVSPPKKVLV